jgi:hypothetical protein
MLAEDLLGDGVGIVRTADHAFQLYIVVLKFIAIAKASFEASCLEWQHLHYRLINYFVLRSDPYSVTTAKTLLEP